MKIIYLMPSLIFLAGIARAQEINFSRVQDMAIWYNQSLKTDKNNSIKFNMRNVKYDGMLAYNSISAMVDVPVLFGKGRESERSGYLSFSAGAASDKSNQGILNNTLGLVGLSYAVPIAGNETYLAIGIQGSYYQSRLNVGNIVAFGDQYNQYGPVEGMASSDRLASGWSYNHLNANAGISLFSNSTNNKWYIGGSVMHLNRPYTDETKSADYRVNQAISIQGGYRFITPMKDDCAFYMTLNWQGNAVKHFFNLSYFKSISGINGGVGIGAGYRYEDALVPNIEFRYAKATISVGYDVNISAFNAAGLSRNGIELAVKMDF